MGNTSNSAETSHSDTFFELQEMKGKGTPDESTLASVFLKDGIIARVDSDCLDEFLIANWENLEARKRTRRGPRRNVS